MEETGDEESQQENSVGWVNTTADKRVRSWDSDSTRGGDYMVMAKNQTDLQLAEVKLPITINGRKTSVWIDSGSPISISTIHELQRTLGAAGIRLQEVYPPDQEFRDYGNNPINFLGTMKVELESNGWSTSAVIKVIGGARPSIIGRDLMSHLGLQLVQRMPGQEMMSTQEAVKDEGESQLEK